MSRGLIGFLIFLAVILLGLAGVGYVLGPNVLAFVFHGERRTEAVIMINLLQFADGDAQQRYRQNYGNPVRTMIEAVGGHRLWSARAADVVNGATADGWSWLTLVQYPSRAAVIELVTSSHYRALVDAGDAELERSAVLAATPQERFTKSTFGEADTTFVVRLSAGAAGDSIDRYQNEWSTQDEVLLTRHQGRVVWQAKLAPLGSDAAQRFDTMSIYGFPDDALRSAWMDDPENKTLLTLQRSLFSRDVVLLARADSDAP